MGVVREASVMEGRPKRRTGSERPRGRRGGGIPSVIGPTGREGGGGGGGGEGGRGGGREGGREGGGEGGREGVLGARLHLRKCRL